MEANELQTQNGRCWAVTSAAGGFFGITKKDPTATIYKYRLIYNQLKSLEAEITLRQYSRKSRWFWNYQYYYMDDIKHFILNNKLKRRHQLDKLFNGSA